MSERLLLLGDPRLRELSEPVDDVERAEVRDVAERLAATLSAFRAEHGFGRALSAPQIGVRLRMVAFALPPLAPGETPRPGGTFVAHNPEITWTSPETFTLWDDCMSFPSLLVRVRRHASVSFRYTDESGNDVAFPELGRAVSELVQHEIDHLDGVLAVDRAIDRFSLLCRDEHARTPQLFRGQVDYAIGE
ncbi:MAG TPA: peptide deformylase [Minicystis sp.]|nr:peptide deformylase [Minicystis sp.]